MHENVPLNDGDFQFSPPTGVVVIDGVNPV